MGCTMGGLGHDAYDDGWQALIGVYGVLFFRSLLGYRLYDTTIDLLVRSKMQLIANEATCC